MARLVSALPLALLCLLALRHVAAQGQGQVTTEFCRQMVSDMDTCPQPRTDNTLVIDLYQGKWYQVATTAQWAFGQWNQLGGQCVTANYTTLGQTVPGIDSIRVVNSYLKTVQDPQRALVALISDTTRAISLNLRGLCQSLLGNVLSISNMNAAINFMDGDKNHTEFQNHLTAVENQVLAASARSRSIFDALAKVQMRNADMNGGSLPVQPNFAAIKEAILNATEEITFFTTLLNNQREWAHDQARHLGPHTLNPATRAAASAILIETSSTEVSTWFRTLRGISIANRALVLATKYIGNFPAFANYTSTFLDNAGEDPRFTARKAEVLLGAEEAAAEKAAIKAAQVAASIPKVTVAARRMAQEVNRTGMSIEALYTPQLTSVNTPQGVVVSATGTATQNPIQDGKWSVSFAPLLNYQYWVLQAWGDAATGYDQALVYSCFADVSTGTMPQTSLFLLSRTPTVPANVIQRARDWAATTDIMIGGDNPLITISQNADLCGEV